VWDDFDDVQLVDAMARGDREALAALYDRYSRLMLAVARRMLRDPQAAEDVVQDVVMEAWRRADSYSRTRGTVRTWLMMRLRSRALDRIRSAPSRREVAVENPRAVAAVGAEDPQLAPDRASVRRALTVLPAEQREVLELAYFRGLSSSEIAVQVGTPIGTVKSRTRAGLEKLRVAMAGPNS
jgi:RNA polymerase sigma-70 factor (ECF subfamily)